MNIENYNVSCSDARPLSFIRNFQSEENIHFIYYI